MFNLPAILPLGRLSKMMFHLLMLFTPKTFNPRPIDLPVVSPSGCLSKRMFHLLTFFTPRTFNPRPIDLPVVSPPGCLSKRMFYLLTFFTPGTFNPRMIEHTDVYFFVFFYKLDVRFTSWHYSHFNIGFICCLVGICPITPRWAI